MKHTLKHNDIIKIGREIFKLFNEIYILINKDSIQAQ